MCPGDALLEILIGEQCCFDLTDCDSWFEYDCAVGVLPEQELGVGFAKGQAASCVGSYWSGFGKR
jgi:hypothetical protein